MTTHDMPLPEEAPVRMQRRVVETEIRLPRLGEMNLPKVDLEPVRDVAMEVLITGLGIGVLMARGVAAAVRAAHDAGKKELENPGPVTRSVMNVMRREGTPASQQMRMAVPVLPLDNYDTLSVAEILPRLPDLTREQLQVLRDYENSHQARVEVLEDLNRRLGEG